jgi:predicted peptidase
MLKLWAALVAALLTMTTPAFARETGFLDRTISVAGERSAYQVYVPRQVRRGMPVILFLHGAGERGSDGLLQTAVGLPQAIRQHVERWPAVVVMPQVPQGRLWQNTTAVARAALERTVREFGSDRKRVYLAGLSMGGNGAWAMAAAEPDRFAAAIIVCGFVQPIATRDYQPIVPPGTTDAYAWTAQQLARLPVWIAHGDADPVVPVADSRAMAAALRSAGGQVTYKELPGVGHNAWDPAFADPALPAWLFAQARRR